MFEIKPFYSTTELRKLTGFVTNKGTKAFLQRLNIPCHVLGGRKDIWFLSDIQTYSPELFSSLTEAAGLHKLLEVQSEEFDETFSSAQFR